MQRSARALVLAGGTVAFASVASLQRRRRRRAHRSAGASRRMLVPAVVLTGARIGLMTPDSLRPDWRWFSGFANWLQAGFAWIADAIAGAVEFGTRFVLGAVQILEHAWNETWETMVAGVAAIVDNVESISHALYDISYSVTTTLANEARNLLGQLNSILEGMVDQALDIIMPYVDRAIRTALDLGGDLLGYIEDLVRSVVDSALDGLFNLDDIARAVWDVLYDVIIEEVMRMAQDIVLAGLETIFAGISEVLGVLVEIWNFAFELLRDWPNSAERLVRSAFDAGAGALQEIIWEVIRDNQDEVMRLVADVFGIPL